MPGNTSSFEVGNLNGKIEALNDQMGNIPLLYTKIDKTDLTWDNTNHYWYKDNYVLPSGYTLIGGVVNFKNGMAIGGIAYNTGSSRLCVSGLLPSGATISDTYTFDTTLIFMKNQS